MKSYWASLLISNYVLKSTSKHCKIASQKLHALARISIYMEPEKLKLLTKAFVMSRFTYCSLIWMFHDRNFNNKINRIHEIALRIAYKDNVSSFDKLQLTGNLVTVHQRNSHLLTIETYKASHDLNPSFMRQIFEEKVLTYNLRCSDKLQLPQAKSSGLGLDTARFVGGGGGGSMEDAATRTDKIKLP